ncbi:hypothetical protein [Ruegeria arenilitoris]|uniref:hypothetical protein n=1 Tax=Ruegeria arenilitoris TaxID=1173585 RepID=UPI00147CBDAD|nr:hypothetical protein [Ruegeria arenilitoris]
MNEPDFEIGNHGSVILFDAKSERAKEWVAEHLPYSALTFAGRYAVEARFAGPVIDGLVGDGLTYC